ncbi:MAG: phosphoribosyl-AMP cyclohydrolase [Bacteroidetes bacterium]|nr:phosphoribosyl-AMP cyclohydrolase [Bacteroidota bacterium]
MPVIVQDFSTKQVLMMAWMNESAWQKTVSTREMWFWSRSRQELWHKGATSGHVQKVIRISVDCDSDVLLAEVDPAGGIACHTGAVSCFFTEVLNAGDRG